MNKRKDEKLIQIAFEDLQKESLTPHELQSVSKYEGLRKDLESLREVPDHQLSNERLRNAILGQGLKPAKESSKSSDGSWFLAMGASAAMIAMFFVGARLHHSSTPAVIDDSANGQVAVNDNFDLRFPDIDLSKGAATPSRELSKSDFSSEIPTSTRKVERVIHRSPHEVRRRIVDQSENNVSPSLYSFNQSPIDSEADELQFQHPAPPVPVAAKDSGQHPPLDKVSSSPVSSAIVEIDQDKDQQTGARSAREVESKNVVVGG